MTKKIETRLTDLERKANPDTKYRVVVSWDDPNFPDKIEEGDEVIHITWDANDDISETTKRPGNGNKE